MLKRIFCRFTRTVAVSSHGLDPIELIRRKAERFERRYKTCGKRSRFFSYGNI